MTARPTAQPFGEHTSVAIQRYVEEALVSTHTRRPTPLPRVRAPRGSEPPNPSGPVAMSVSEVSLAALANEPRVWSIDDDVSIPNEFSDDDDTVETSPSE